MLAEGRAEDVFFYTLHGLIFHLLRGNLSDGMHKYSTKDGSVNMAVFKDGDEYRIYDYDGQNISRSLTKQEVNRVLNKYWKEGVSSAKAEINSESSAENKKAPAKKASAAEGARQALIGRTKDGKGIYKSNFPKGTPKAAKSKKILDYISNVWSRDPISLVISNGETSRTILAQFDPTIDSSQNTPTDASKLAGGNRHGNHTEQRVTLDLADDYYQIASEAKYNYSKEETGKASSTHSGVKMWHYFVNDIYFVEQGESELIPYTVTINVKEKASGDFVYSFNAEKTKEPTTRQTLHAAVNARKGANGELFIDSIPENAEKSNSFSEKSLETAVDSSTEGGTDAWRKKVHEIKERRSVAEIEAYCKDNIDGYNKLSAPSQQAVRMTVRQARAHGLSDMDVKTYGTVAARSGLNIIFDGEMAFGDGALVGNNVYVNPKLSAARTYELVLGHEMFHKIFTSGGKRARRLVTTAFKNIAPEKSREIAERYIDFYKKQDRQMKEYMPIVNEEIAAAYSEEIFNHEGVWEYILSKEPTLGQKVLSFFRGSARDYSFNQGMSRQARKFVRDYKKLFDAVAERNRGNNELSLMKQAVTGEETPVTSINDKNMRVTGDNDEADDGVRHALCEFEDGKRFVMVEIDQDRFDGLSTKEQTDLATKVIKSRFQGKVIGLDNKAFVNGVTANEYTHPSKHIDDDLYTAKMRASTELDNLMDAGFNFRVSADGRDGHIHASAVGGFGYFDVVFRVANEYYQGVINIENNRRGKRLKDITKIENITKDVTSQYGNNPTYAFLRDASMDSIHENGEKINPSDENSSEISSGKRHALKPDAEGESNNVETDGQNLRDGDIPAPWIFNDAEEYGRTFNPDRIIGRGLPRTPGRSSLSGGELKKIIADHTRKKVYSKKQTAEAFLNKGVLKGQGRVSRRLFLVRERHRVLHSKRGVQKRFSVRKAKIHFSENRCKNVF